jgi:RNA polymerase sigma factor (TIGR02999 family)
MHSPGPPSDQHAITRLLAGMKAGEPTAKERFVEAVYLELKRMAQKQLRGERPGQSIQASALVNDLYLRMLGRDAQNWENRAHFFCAAASNLRRILIDRARRRRAHKRGGEFARVDFDEQLRVYADSDDANSERLLALDDALVELARLDERQARIVELRFFAGLTGEETAAAMNLSRRTVNREWTMARAWLHDRIQGQATSPSP